MKKLLLIISLISTIVALIVLSGPPLTVGKLLNDPDKYNGREVTVRGHTDIIKTLETLNIEERFSIGYSLVKGENRLIVLSENGEAAGSFIEVTGVFYKDYNLNGNEKPVLIETSKKSLWR